MTSIEKTKRDPNTGHVALNPLIQRIPTHFDFIPTASQAIQPAEAEPPGEIVGSRGYRDVEAGGSESQAGEGTAEPGLPDDSAEQAAQGDPQGSAAQADAPARQVRRDRLQRAPAHGQAEGRLGAARGQHPARLQGRHGLPVPESPAQPRQLHRHQGHTAILLVHLLQQDVQGLPEAAALHDQAAENRQQRASRRRGGERPDLLGVFQ